MAHNLGLLIDGVTIRVLQHTAGNEEVVGELIDVHCGRGIAFAVEHRGTTERSHLRHADRAMCSS